MRLTVKFSNAFVWCMWLFFAVALVAAWPQMVGLWLGIPDGLLSVGDGGSGARYLREMTLILLLGFMLMKLKSIGGIFSKTSRMILLGLAAYLLFEIILATVVYDLPFVVSLAGMRILEYFPITICILYLASKGNIDDVNFHVAKMLCLFILIQIIIGVVEVFFAAPTTGATIFGSRAFGTFSNPNIYGIVLSGCAMLLYLIDSKRYKKWVVLVFLGAFLSGSRAGMIASVIILCIQLFPRKSRLNISTRGIIISFLPLLFVLTYLAVSSQELSGRVINGEERIDVWGVIFQNFTSVFRVIFGFGLGLGSNTVTAVFGAGAFTGQFISDNFFVFILTSYGLVMFVLLLLFLYFLLIYNMNYKVVAFLLFFILVSMTNISLEIYPLNILIMYALGLLLIPHRKR